MPTGTPSPFFGMRGSGNFNADQVPGNWREVILKLYPNGSAPLTAMLSMMRSEKTDNTTFNWFSKRFATQSGAITGVYLNSTLTSAAGAAQDAGAILYIKVAETVAAEFRVGHQAQLLIENRPELAAVGDVLDVVKSGAESFIKVKLLNSTASGVAVNGNYNIVWVVGNAAEEGATIPDSITYDPRKYSNHTQIFRTPLSMTRTAIKTKLRTEAAREAAKAEALEMHSIEMEKAFLLQEFGETIVNGKPKRFMRGLIPAIREYCPENVHNFAFDTEVSGETWINAGEDWLEDRLEEMTRYGTSDNIILAGSGALKGLSRIARQKGTYEFTSAKGAYGISLTEWVTSFGSYYIKTHPLLSQQKAYRNSMVFLTPRYFLERFIDQTMFKGDDYTGSRNNGRDGIDEEFLTETSLEYHFLDTTKVIHNVGVDNDLT